MGTSAGGNLALAVTNSLILQGSRSKIRGVVVLNALTSHGEGIPSEYQDLHTSYFENATDVPMVDKHFLDLTMEMTKLKPSDTHAFATLSPCLKEFPRTWIATSEKDVLRDDGIVLEKMLVAQNVGVKRKHYLGFGHCFWVFPQLPKRQEFLEDVVEGIAFVLQE